MLNDMKIRSGIIWRVLVVVLIAGIGLYACGGGGGTTAGAIPGGSGGGGGGGGGGGPIGNPIIPSGIITAFATDPAGTIVTSPNTLVVGSEITISGTTDYNGTFTVVAVTSASFTITRAFVPNNATGTWTGSGGVIASCTTTGSTGAIMLPNPGNLASRYIGVAPLAVFFDATGTTTTPATPRPFHDLEYQWNFGDVTAGNWSYGAHTFAGDTSYLKSKNRATGPVAAHVYEQPGTYIVSVTVRDATNTITNACMQISVLDPNVVFAGANTTCVNASGADHTGCPLIGASPAPYLDSVACVNAGRCVTQSDWPTIVNTYLGTNKRIMLKGGGSVYTGAAGTSVAVVGPALIGAYGTGAKPVLQTTSVTNFSKIIALAGVVSDLRLVDLDIDGQSDIRREAMASEGTAVINNLLMLRLDIHNIGGGIEIPLEQVAAVPNGIALVDSTVRFILGGGATSNSHGILVGADNVAIMGSDFNDSTGGSAEHMLRMQFLNKAVISSNTIANVQKSGPPGNKEMLTIRGPCTTAVAACTPFASLGLTGAAAATRFVVTSDNLVKTNTFAGIQLSQVVSTWPTDIHDVIIERNYLQHVAGSGTGIRVVGNNITVRNNLVDISNGTLDDHIGIQTSGATAGMAAPSNVFIYNNTIFSVDTGDFFGGFLLPGTGIIFTNNIGYAPNATTTFVMLRDNATGTTIANNTCNTSDCATDIKTSPMFGNASTLLRTPTDFNLTGGYALDSGSVVPVFSDFFGVARPQGAAIDIGATEQ